MPWKGRKSLSRHVSGQGPGVKSTFFWSSSIGGRNGEMENMAIEQVERERVPSCSNGELRCSHDAEVYS